MLHTFLLLVNCSKHFVFCFCLLHFDLFDRNTGRFEGPFTFRVEIGDSIHNLSTSCVIWLRGVPYFMANLNVKLNETPKTTVNCLNVHLLSPSNFFCSY